MKYLRISRLSFLLVGLLISCNVKGINKMLLSYKGEG